MMSNGMMAVLVFAGLALFAGCASTEEGAEGDERRSARRARADVGYVELDLAAPAADVRTVQLFLGSDERQLPILRMGSSNRLTLAFDLMSDRGRPLSVYFYHADRTWRRDLTPAEYLTSFQRDDLLNYSPSIGTQVRYTHYTYRFPNRSIDFRISGNYILRVTEQGNEDAVLFEQPFFVTEQSASADMALDQVMLGGQGFAAIQPIVAFTPPSDIQGNAYDYNVCFARNGRFNLTRCSDRPMLAQQPTLQFYLEPEASFEPAAADYFVDLGNLQVSNRIARTDLSTDPFTVVLEPDYARFAGSGLDPLLNGQPVVSGAVQGVADAGLSAEYVAVRFSYVPPDEQPVAGEVLVTGSFNNWRYAEENVLTWVPENGRYEGDILLKQGQYEYRYVSSDPDLSRALVSNLPRADNLYTSLIYYRDIRFQTDRLIAVQGIISR